MAPQIMDALSYDEEVAGAMESADYGPLFDRLQHGVWSHGRARTRDELLADLAGKTLQLDAYLSYLSRKFGREPVH